MLSCTADGDPTPKIIWTKDGVPFRQFNSSGSDLHLTNVQRENVGSYRCTATNAYGSTTGIAVVNINCKQQLLLNKNIFRSHIFVEII